MRIYVAGPMTGYLRWNFDAFDAATAELRAAGHLVCSPADMDRERGFDPDAPISEFSVEDRQVAMGDDIQAVLEADAVAVLPGWEDSTGAQLEVAVAHAIGVFVAPVAFFTSGKDAS